jgi:isovaleryl-CoA dehydrogenase
MIDLRQYGFEEQHQHIHDMAWRYARERHHPLLRRMDDDDWFPEDEYRKMGEVGLLGTTVPESLGGPGLDLVSQFFIGEALSYWNNMLGASWGASENLCINNMVRNASAEQQARFLPRMLTGGIGALGLTEPGAGSDALGSMKTTARRDGDHYVLNGRKMFITNGPVADMLLIYAKTTPERGQHGISAFVVEKGTPGFSVAQSLKKMGWRGSPTGELLFDDCRVPAANLIGGEDKGVKVVMSGLDIERVFFSGHVIAIAQRALDLSLDYARTRVQFGQPIAGFQLVQGMLADMYTALESVRAFSYQLLKEVSAAGEAGRGEIHKRSAAAVLHAGYMLKIVLDHAVQIHGGNGFMWETEVNCLYRAGKLIEIGAGTTQVRQLIIAQELLKA